jgi:hypothetical protein
MKQKLKTQNAKLKTQNGGGISPLKNVCHQSFAFCVLGFAFSSFCFAIEAPPRVFFSDAKLSFTYPDAWQISPSFPVGPLFVRVTQEGTQAFIACQISEPVDSSRISAEISSDVLKEFALAGHAAQSRMLSSSARTLAGRPAYEITWENSGTEGVTQYQSIYFFVDNRFYMLSLRASRDSFPWLVPDFQTWLETVRVLSRRESGTLDSPAHGGVWIHQTAGGKVPVPEDWLIAVADDRQLGATVARDKMHVDLTVTVEVLNAGSPEDLSSHKKPARKSIEKKRHRVTAETDAPFHGYPSFQFAYEGSPQGRFIRGQDIWVASPRALWLISVEGDSVLMRQIQEELEPLLAGIQFL